MSFRKTNKLYTYPLLTLLSLLFLFFSKNVFPQNFNEGFFSPLNRLKFANYLFSQSDYLRAADEFRAFLRTQTNDTVKFKLAESLLNISRFSEAGDHFKGIFFNRDLGDYAKLEFYRSLFLSGNYSFFRETINQENYLPEKFLLEVKRLGAISYFFDDISLPDSTSVLQYFISDSVKSRIKDFYLRKKNPPYKSPLKASLLSAVLPGAGKIYTGQISDGITAFVATSVLTFLAVDNFNASHRFRGWLFSGLALLSYTGNIYGSAASAQLYNAEIRFNLNKEIKLYFEKRNYFLPSIDFIR